MKTRVTPSLRSALVVCCTVLSLGFFCTIGSLAQEKVLIKNPVVKAQAPQSPSVPLAKPRPAQLTSLPADLKDPPPPPLELSTKLNVLRSLQAVIVPADAADGDEQDVPPSSIETIELSARHSYISGQAYLTLLEPRLVNPELNVVWSPAKGGNYLTHFFRIHMNLEQGRKYLIDMSVRSFGGQELSFSFTGGGPHKITIPSGNSHALLAVEAEQSGMISMLVSGKRSLYFYSVEIAKVD